MKRTPKNTSIFHSRTLFFQKEIVKEELQKVKYETRAAQNLGISRTTLRKLLTGNNNNE